MNKIVINKDPWQTRIAILKNNELQHIYFAAHAEGSLERSFFKGTVSAILPGIQTVFVDIGQEKAGFLHISEIDRELAMNRIGSLDQLDEQDRPSRKEISGREMDVAKIFKVGEPVLVQVSKEPVYEKGPKLTTCFTLPGRYIVLLPNIPRMGVSKKIEDRKERQRLKEVIGQQLPEGMGAIIRTTAEGCNPKSLHKDIAFLISTWENIQKNFATAQPHEKIYEDLELSLQIVRDHLDEQVEAIITDNKENQQQLYTFIKTISPEHTQAVKLFTEPINIFDYFGIEKQLDKALEKKVQLRSGGSLIIETTEAMTVIDVNTGSFVGKKSMEDTILKTNLEAAEEVVRQLRLRNIGGIIVIDFIDMAEAESRNKLFAFFEQTLREHDKFQSVVLKISEFGLVQMTRKRSGKTLVQTLTDTCPTCKGSGFIKSVGTESYTILRTLKVMLSSQKGPIHVELAVSQAVFEYITTHEYNALLYLEKNYNCTLVISRQDSFTINQYKIIKK